MTWKPGCGNPTALGVDTSQPLGHDWAMNVMREYRFDLLNRKHGNDVVICLQVPGLIGGIKVWCGDEKYAGITPHSFLASCQRCLAAAPRVQP